MQNNIDKTKINISKKKIQPANGKKVYTQYRVSHGRMTYLKSLEKVQKRNKFRQMIHQYYHKSSTFMIP